MPDDPGETFVLRTLLGDTGPSPKQLALQVPPGDDAAVLADGLVLTQDSFLEGVHWDERFSAHDVGVRLAMANLSDIGAMGARPTWALLSIALPKPLDRAWVAQFSAGLSQGLQGAPLIGGDTCSSPGPRVLTLTLGGALCGPVLRRSGASPGQDIWVSGQLGAAAGGFYGVPELLPCFLRPKPPLELGPALSQGGLASAAMDLSDGLAQDLERICQSSGVGAWIDPSQLPLPPALLQARPDPISDAVGFGEDFELLFCAPVQSRLGIEALAGRLGLRLTRIGHTTEPGVCELAGRAWPQPWTHFGGSP